MDQNPLSQFGTTAKSLSRNPLGLIALFIVLVYGLACLVIITGTSLSASERLPVIYFLIVFPFVVLGVFTYLVSFRAGQLFAPGDFRKEEIYLELQKMRLSAVASLSVAKQAKDRSQAELKSFAVDDIVKSVNNAVELAQKGADNPVVLWVDDNPRNNIYEQKAMEAVGIRFVLSEDTKDALALLSHQPFGARQPFGAVISDMGRREGPREGYVLLDAMRSGGDETPLFFYASSNAPEHKRETYEHGGQGCTNDGQELFEMVTKAIFGSRMPEWRCSYKIFDLVDSALHKEARKTGDWRKAELDLYDKLTRGVLVSRGFYQPSNEEGDIPAHYWKEMRFKEGSHFTEAEGGRLHYVGISVARR
jgi:CheY-like chemotaxis protein